MPSAIYLLSQSITGDCSNTNSGAFEIEISGTSPGYSVIWNSPSYPTTVLGSAPYTYNISSLSGGTYSFYIQDATPSTLPITFYISTGTCVTIESQNTTCGLNNGVITANTSSIYYQAKFYLYETTQGYINSGTTTVPTTEFLFTNLSAGTYYVVADDGGGCTGKSQSCIVKSSSTLNFDLYVIDNASCLPGVGAGAIYVTNLNGTPPYTYLWNTTPPQTTSYITGLTSGSYNVTVTDASNCQILTGATINNVDPIGFASNVVISPGCFDSTGQVVVTITGGTGPYYYQGSNGQTVITFSQTYTFTSVPSGNLTITVTDAGLCSITETVNVVALNGFSNVIFSTTNSNCSATDGKIDVQLTSASQPFTFTIIDSLSNVVVSDSQNPGNCGPPSSTICWTYQGLPSGTYTLNITGGTCTYNTSFTIVNNPLLIVGHSYTATTCNGRNGAIELTVSGGSGTYEYELVTAGFPPYMDTVSASAYTFNGIGAGSYVGSVTDGLCTVSTNIFIPPSQNVNFNWFSIPPTPYANNGSLTALITSGTPPFTLNWSSNVNGQTGITVNNLSAGTYSLTVIDANGCVYSRNIKLQGPLPITSYQLYNICDSDFVNSGLLITKGVKQMLLEGFYDLTVGDTNCILNEALFKVIVTVGSETMENTFFTGTTLNDYPTNEEFTTVVENMLLDFQGVTGVTLNYEENSIKITTPCNTLQGNNVVVDLVISYDVSCVATDNEEPPL